MQTPLGESSPSAGVPSEREQSLRANQSAFDAVFAQLAQFASVDASRNGKLSLGVGASPPTDSTRDGSRGSLAEGVAREAGPPRGGAEFPGMRGSSRLSDSIAEAQRRLGRGRAEPSVGKVSASGDSSAGAAPESARSAGPARFASQAGTGGERVGPDAVRDTSAAGASAPHAGMAGIAGNTADLPGRPLGASGQSAAISAVGKAGGNAPGAGATPSISANAIVLGGRAGGASLAATPPKAAAPPAADSAKTLTTFRAQVAQGLAAALRQGRGDVTLRLTPKALGELRIELRVREGSVDARLRPATDEARGLLERSVETLRHALEARGLRVGRIEIEQVSESREGSQAQQQHEHPGGQDGRAGTHGEQGRHFPAEPGRGQGGRGAGVRRAVEDGSEREAEDQSTSRMAGGPGVVYGVADGAARIVMVDALV